MASAGAIALGGGTKTRKMGKKAKAGASTQLSNLRRRMSLDKAKAKVAGVQALHVAEMQGACMAVGAANGYLGADRMQMFGFDAALLVGGAITAYGLVDGYRGGKASAHLLAIGNGVLAAGMFSMGQRMGAEWGAGGGIFSGREAFVTPNTAGRAGVRRARR